MATVDIYKIKVNVSGDQDVRGLQKDLNSLEGGLNKAGKSILKLGAAAAAGFAAVGVSAFKMADAVADSANGLGIAIDRFYQIALAAEQSGISFDDAAKFMGKFAKSVDAATKGSQDMLDNFSKAGISAEELATLTDEALFTKVVAGLAEMGAGADQTAVSMGLLGKQARDLEFDTFSEELKKNGEEAKEAARLIELGGKAADSLERAFRQLQVASLNVFEPIIQAMADFDLKAQGTQTTIKVLGGLMAAIGGAVLAANIVKLALAFKQVAGAVRAVVVGQTALTALMGPAGWAAIAGAVVATGAAVIALDAAMGDTADSTSDVTGEVVKLTAEEEKLEKARILQAGADDLALGLAKDRVSVSKNNIALAQKQLRESISLIGVETNAANLRKANLTAEATASKEIELIQGLINQEEEKKSNTMAEQVKLYKAQQDSIRANLELTKELNREQSKSLAFQQLMSTIQKSAFSRLKNEAAEADEKLQREALLEQISGRRSAQQIADTLELRNLDLAYLAEEAVLDKQMEQAKLKNDEAAINRILLESIALSKRYLAESEHIKKLQELRKQLNDSSVAGAVDALAEIQASLEPFQLASDAVTMTWGKIGSAIDDMVDNGKSSFSDLADSILKDLAKMLIKAYLFKLLVGGGEALGFDMSFLDKKATGGPVKKGQSYIVGEKGPEIFQAPSAGNIIPNHRLQSSMGAGSTQASQAGPVTNNYVTNNINALDSRSVAQVFAENRQTLLGTVEYARKETSYGV